jgi:hypothetical protein
MIVSYFGSVSMTIPEVNSDRRHGYNNVVVEEQRKYSSSDFKNVSPEILQQ